MGAKKIANKKVKVNFEKNSKNFVKNSERVNEWLLMQEYLVVVIQTI